MESFINPDFYFTDAPVWKDTDQLYHCPIPQQLQFFKCLIIPPPLLFFFTYLLFNFIQTYVILHFYRILINKFSFVWITVKTQKCIIWTIQEIFIVNVSPQASLPPLSDSYMEASNVELSLGSWILAISKLFISSVLNLLHSAFKQWTRRNQFTQHLRRATSLWCLVRVPMVQPATLHH